MQMPIMSRASLPFVHSSLAIQHSPAKGRLVIASTTIEPATVLMVDLPYALVPAPVAHEPPFSLCSNHKCHRRITACFSSSTEKHKMRQLSLSLPKTEATHRTTQLPQPVRCSQHCGDEVVWCSHDCQFQDAQRHLLECEWLRAYRSPIQADESVVEFELLWLLVKIFIRKHFDEQEAQKDDPQEPVVDGQQIIQKQHQCTTPQTGISPASAQSHFERRGWDSVWDLAGSPDYFPAEDVARWRELAEKYLVDQIQDVKCNLDQAMGIIYRLETNSFGLYPGITGIFPITSHEGRGEYYGSGLYPTAAMFNHACGPNVSLPPETCVPESLDVKHEDEYAKFSTSRSHISSTSTTIGSSPRIARSCKARSVASRILTSSNCRTLHYGDTRSGRNGLLAATANDARTTGMRNCQNSCWGWA